MPSTSADVNRDCGAWRPGTAIYFDGETSARRDVTVELAPERCEIAPPTAP